MAYSVEVLKSKRKSAKANRKTYKNRSSQIQKIYNDGFKMDDYYSKIKRNVEKCTSELVNGISGISCVIDKCNTIESQKESQCLSYQNSYSGALSSLNREKGRCDEKVKDYDTQIAKYEKQIKEQGGIIYPWE